MSISVNIENVNVTLGNNHVLKDLSLRVDAGEFVTLLGASGSGKSTLLNVIAGLQQIDSGVVEFDRRNMVGCPPQDRNVGVVFQSYALFPHMTVAKNVAFPLIAARKPRKVRDAVVAEMLGLVQLEGMSDRMPMSLSGGQRQRVALARALAADPGVLLLDEPMAALDKQLRDRMQVEIKRIQQHVGKTTIAVTHDQTEALTLSDRVAIMQNGVFVQVDTPWRLYNKPASEYVATFLGEANLFGFGRGRIVGPSSDAESEGTLVVRPEHLQPIDSPDNSGYRVRGVVRLLSFQGERWRLEAEGPGGMTMVSSLRGGTDAARFRPGEEVWFAPTDPDHFHVVPRLSTPRVEAEL